MYIYKIYICVCLCVCVTHKEKSRNVLSNTAVASHMWILNTCNVASLN